MSDKDQIKDLFSDKLGGFEAKVNPELWTNIASQIGTTAATTASVGMSLATKIIIGVSAASVITVSALLISNSEDTPEKEEPKKEQVSELTSEDYKTPVIIDVNDNEPQSDLKAFEPTIETQGVEQNAAKVDEPLETQTGNLITDNELQKSIIRLNTVLAETGETTTNNTSADVKEENDNTSQSQGVLEEPRENLSKEDQVEVPEQKKQEEKLDIILPNVFTPNGDYANDELMMEVPENVTDFQITVLNSAGKVVYESDDPNFRWSGRHYLSGDKVTAGQYVYFVILKVGNNDTIEKSSFLKVSY